MYRSLLLLSSSLLLLALVCSKSIHRQERDVQAVIPVMSQMAASHRQLGGGLSALGTLISPLLFLMGMGSFMSMLPQMFQTVMSGVGSNLIQSFTGGAAAGGAPSSRLRRTVDGPQQQILRDDLLDELARRINLAVLKYERPN